MSYAAGVSGAKASTIYPCGHMAYYDSGSAPQSICPICGARHQNANFFLNSTSYVPPSSNIGFAQATAQLINVPEPVPEYEYPGLTWLDRELSRHTKR